MFRRGCGSRRGLGGCPAQRSQRNARFGGTGVVHRRKVKEIGTNLKEIGTNRTNLGMSKVAACEQFLALRGRL
jgi:hypothetical protein